MVVVWGLCTFSRWSEDEGSILDLISFLMLAAPKVNSVVANNLRATGVAVEEIAARLNNAFWVGVGVQVVLTVVVLAMVYREIHKHIRVLLRDLNET
jgi:hypothetical protein